METGRGDLRLCVYYDPTKKDLQTCLGRRREELGDVTFMLALRFSILVMEEELTLIIDLDFCATQIILPWVL